MKTTFLLLVTVTITSALLLCDRDQTEYANDPTNPCYLIDEEDHQVIQTCLLHPGQYYFHPTICDQLQNVSQTDPHWYVDHLSHYFTLQASSLWNALIAFHTDCWPHWTDPTACKSLLLEHFERHIDGYMLLKNQMRKRMYEWIDSIDAEGDAVKHCFHYHKRIAPNTGSNDVTTCLGISYQLGRLEMISPARVPFIRQKWAHWISHWNNVTSSLNSTGNAADADEATLLNCLYTTEWQTFKHMTGREMIDQRNTCALLNYPDVIAAPDDYLPSYFRRIRRLAPAFYKRKMKARFYDCLYDSLHRMELLPHCKNLVWEWSFVEVARMVDEIKTEAIERAARMAALNAKLFPVVDFVIRLQNHCAQGHQMIRSNWTYDCSTLDEDFPTFKMLNEYADYVKSF